jgi:hypothetical protein
LAWKAARDDVHGFGVFVGPRSNIVVTMDIGPMLCQYLSSIVIDLDLPSAF